MGWIEEYRSILEIGSAESLLNCFGWIICSEEMLGYFSRGGGDESETSLAI